MQRLKFFFVILLFQFIFVNSLVQAQEHIDHANDIEDRLSYLEQELQKMRGENEELRHQLQQLSQSGPLKSKDLSKSEPGSALQKSVPEHHPGRESLSPMLNQFKPIPDKEVSSDTEEDDVLDNPDADKPIKPLPQRRLEQKGAERKNQDEKAAELKGDDDTLAPEDSAAGSLPEGTPQEEYEAGIERLSRGDYHQAEAIFQRFLKHHPKHQLTINVLYWLGETFYVRKNYKQASIHFADAYKLYTQLKSSKNSHQKDAKKNSYAKAPEALVKLALSLKGLKQKSQACVVLDQLSEEFKSLPKNVEKLAMKARTGLNCQ